MRKTDFGLRRTGGERRTVIILVAFILIATFKSAMLRVGQTLLFLRRCNDAQIMFAMLKIIFSRHIITGCLRIPTQLQIFFSNMLGGTTNFYIGPIGLIAAR